MPEFGEKVLKGDKVKRPTTVDVDSRSIVAVATTKKSGEDPHSWYHQWTFDLTDAPDEFIWQHAARSLVIDKQRAMRDDENFDIANWGEATFVYPADFQSAPRQRKPRESDAKEWLSKLTPAERLAWVQALEEEEADAGDE